jgi:PAS domain S-box-containing protein
MKLLIELLLLISCVGWFTILAVSVGYTQKYLSKRHGIALIKPLVYALYLLAAANGINSGVNALLSLLGKQSIPWERAPVILLSQMAVVIFAYVATHYYRRLPEFIEKAELHKRNSDRFKAIADSIHDGIIEYCGEGVIRYANTSAMTMFGYQELLGENFADLLDPPLALDHMREVKQVASTGINRFKHKKEAIEMIALGSSGNKFHIEVTLSAYEISEDVGWRFTALVRDITRRKELESLVH